MKNGRLFCVLLGMISRVCHPQDLVVLRPATLAASLKKYTDTSVNVAGLLDKQFGAQGLIKQPFLTADFFNIATGLAVTSDGRIVLGGYVGDAVASQWKLALVRYLPSGALDTSFGNQGVVLQQFSNLLYDQINALALQSDGSLLSAGGTRTGVGQYQFLLARYLSNGLLDTTYGVQGKVDQPFFGTDFYDEIKAVALAGSGNAVVTGYSKDGGGQKLIVASYTPQGVLNEEFGAGGKVLQPFLGDQQSDTGTALVVDTDATVVVGGISADGGVGKIKCVFLRYDASGNLVSSFGKNGSVLQPFIGSENHDEVICLGLQSNGAILVGGFTSDAGGQKALLIRYTSQGLLDPTFGDAGIVMQAFLSGPGSTDVINAFVVQPDGKIVVAGSTNGGGGDKYFLARYDTQGVLDPSFGTNGVVISPFIGDGAGDEIQDLALTPSGRLIATGCTLDAGGSKMFVTCVMDAVDPSFFGGCGGFYG